VRGEGSGSAVPSGTEAGSGHTLEHAIDMQVLVDIGPVHAVARGLDAVVQPLLGRGLEQSPYHSSGRLITRPSLRVTLMVRLSKVIRSIRWSAIVGEVRMQGFQQRVPLLVHLADDAPDLMASKTIVSPHFSN
jgi:hypothetical protein